MSNFIRSVGLIWFAHTTLSDLLILLILGQFPQPWTTSRRVPPAPPPPNGICLSIPYTARVESGGDDLPSVPAAKCEGSFIQSSACRAGKIASGISSIGNLFASKAKEGRVTNTTPKSYPKATVQRIKEEYKDHASNTFLLNAITFEETSDLVRLFLFLSPDCWAIGRLHE